MPAPLHPDVHRIRSAILREVQRTSPTPSRVLRCRVYLYANLNKRWNGFSPIKFLWTGINDAIADLVAQRAIVAYSHDPGGTWYGLPGHFPGGQPTEPAFAEITSKAETLRLWDEALEAGRRQSYLEVLVHGILKDDFATKCGFKPRFPDGREREIDIWAAGDGLTLWIECKNVFSECYESPPPDQTRWTADQRQIQDRFQAAAALGRTHHPVLIASLVDETFYGFQRPYRGFAIRTLHQFLRPEYQAVAKEIRKVFRIGHVKAVEEPPAFLVKNVRALPTSIRRTYA